MDHDGTANRLGAPSGKPVHVTVKAEASVQPAGKGDYRTATWWSHGWLRLCLGYYIHAMVTLRLPAHPDLRELL
jgi:hypothetical protein